MVVFSSVRLGVSPKVNALATLLVAAVMLGALLAWWLMRRYAASQRAATLPRH
jgi:putrescine transport system permease protein